MKSLPHDEFDIDKYRNMEPVQMMIAMRRDLEFKMPPRGVTITTARFGGFIWRRMTWRCEVEGCWYMTTPSTDAGVASLRAYHAKPGEEQCPTPPRRECLPSGKMEIEKLWAEIDDVVDALQDKTSYRNMSTEEMKGYAKGLAWSVVMKETQFFPNVRSVTVEAVKRWKRRKGTLPWETTPSSHTHAYRWFSNGGWVPVKRDDDPAPLKRAAPKKSAPATVAKKRAWTEAQVEAIKVAVSSGMFTPEDLASSYDCTPADIQSALAG